jgi:hypothetical protein
MTVVQSLFGPTPEQIQAQQRAAMQQEALQFSQMSPMQQAQYGIFSGANMLGGGIAQAMGYEDPEIKAAKERQGLLGGVALSDPASLRDAAQKAWQAGNYQVTQNLLKQAQEMELSTAETQEAKARASKFATDQQREEQLRSALSELPANATPEQYLDVVRRYGSPDKVMTSIQTSMDREAQRRQALELKQAEIQARIDIAKMNGERDERIAQMQIDGRREMAAFAAALKQSTQADKPEKVLPARLQQAEDDDYEAIDTVTNLLTSIDPVIQSLGGYGEKGVNPTLRLSALNNTQNQLKNFIGMSTAESQQYAQLQETKARIVNESLRLNKGVQTEGDAVRAATEVEAAWAKNDTEATRKALVRLVEINKRAKKNKEAQIARRRQSQGVKPPQTQMSDEDIINKYLK